MALLVAHLAPMWTSDFLPLPVRVDRPGELEATSLVRMRRQETVPEGGVAGATECAQGGRATFTDNNYLIPLVGGSGGGGILDASGYFGSGGGAGGGAIPVASSTQIIVNGTITANGGQYGCGVQCGCLAGAGGGGAVRLVSNNISGSGIITARGGYPGGSGVQFAQHGRARLEANTISFTGSFNSTPLSESTPLSNFNSFIPTVPQPSIQVTKINGQTISENPFSFPDTTINSDQPVPAVITGHNVPLGTVPALTILGETADQDLTCTGGLQGTLATSTCTVNTTFAFGGSRGLSVTAWQNPGSNVLRKQ